MNVGTLVHTVFLSYFQVNTAICLFAGAKEKPCKLSMVREIVYHNGEKCQSLILAQNINRHNRRKGGCGLWNDCMHLVFNGLLNMPHDFFRRKIRFYEKIFCTKPHCFFHIFPLSKITQHQNRNRGKTRVAF